MTSTLNSLTCSCTNLLHSTHMFLIGNCFPQLERIDLTHCNHIHPDTLHLLLKGCCDNITHLNLSASSFFPEHRKMNFQLPKLKVLNLSHSSVCNRTLYVLTKSCPGLLQLSLKYCDHVEDRGVNSALRNCKQLTKINLKHCPRVVRLNVDQMLLRRPSLRKIKLPFGVSWVAPLVSTKA
jgi:hypothetical protein